MDTNNWRPTAPAGEPTMDAGDWRAQLPPDTRQRIVNKIMETLRKCLPFSGQGRLQELENMTVRFEEEIYTAATSQPDYLRKISLETLRMETESQNNILNGMASNNVNNPSDPGASLDSTAQTGHANGGDWQEEVYQKIKVMNETYYPDLNVMYKKIAAKLQQPDSLPQQTKSYQLEQLRKFKMMLERMMRFLQVAKSSITPLIKEKLGRYEKQIVDFINASKRRKTIPSMQQGQVPQPHIQTVQQTQSQIPQAESHEKQMNRQLQQMNLQGS